MDSPPSREPIFNVPLATLILALIILGIHAIRVWLLSDEADFQLVFDWSFIPLRLDLLWARDEAMEELKRLVTTGAQFSQDSIEYQKAVIAARIGNDGSGRALTLVTHAFLHGGWTHVIVNSLWLVAFGGAVDRRFGSLRYILLGLVATAAGALAHMAIDPLSPLPLIGASGAVSGFTGAMARFAFSTGGPLGRWRAPGDDAFRYPAAPLVDFFRNSRAMIFVALWFGLNILTGIAAVPLGVSDEPVAWMAHVGGFAAGFLLFDVFDPIGRLPKADLH
ncbi:rhomboid family intramembrane serine protease [Terrarubrum flagellatum]|uniref:rhomboid family intramembrane serine protease n=1 Tax=Terrirubrum flagellatum TaxID=2895980 RepID=UPI0031452769